MLSPLTHTRKRVPTTRKFFRPLLFQCPGFLHLSSNRRLRLSKRKRKDGTRSIIKIHPRTPQFSPPTNTTMRPTAAIFPTCLGFKCSDWVHCSNAVCQTKEDVTRCNHETPTRAHQNDVQQPQIFSKPFSFDVEFPRPYEDPVVIWSTAFPTQTIVDHLCPFFWRPCKYPFQPFSSWYSSR